MILNKSKYKRWIEDGLINYHILADKKYAFRFIRYKRLQKSLTKVHYEQGRIF